MHRILGQKQFSQAILILAGCAIYALGLNLFILPLGLYSGGVVGLAQLLSLALEQVPHGTTGTLNLYGLIYFLLNVPLLAIAWLKLGKSFLFKTVIGTMGISVFTTAIPQPMELLATDPAVAIVIGGAVTGLGIGIMLTAGGSGGGIEVLGLWLSKKNPNFTVGRITSIFNVALYIVYFFVFDASTVIYSLLYMILYTVALDKSHYQNINARVTVFTKEPGIDQAIMKETGRGLTEWNGCGAFTREDSHILVTIINKYEIDEVMKIIHSIDKNAFIIIDEGVRVFGNFQRRL